jgi:hypothetical protein
VQPQSIEVHVTVRNAGTARSEPKPMVVELGRVPNVTVTIPAIDVGKEYNTTLRIRSPKADGFLINTDTMRIGATIAAVGDNPANNSAVTPAFHLALPTVRLSFVLNATSLRANAPVTTGIMVENVSRHAALSQTTVAFCIYDLGGACRDEFNGRPFGSLVLPSMPAFSSQQADYELVVPSEAADQNVNTLYALGSCIAPGYGQAASVVPLIGECVGVRDVTVKPDYEACEPVELVVDVPVETKAVCHRPCDIFAYTTTVERGRSYYLETVDGIEDKTLAWRTRYRDVLRDGSSAAGFQPVEPAKLYVVTAPKYCGGAELRHSVVLRVN